MELKETAKMMQSQDYKERFKAEYYQLCIRYNKLKEMLEKWDTGSLGFTPTCKKWILKAQRDTMADYIGILESRAEFEKIDIHNDADK